MDSLTVPGTLDSLSAIAKYIMEIAQEAGLEKKAAYKLRLGVDEIATNIIIHGYEEAGLEGDVTCHAQMDDQSLTIILEDTGIAYDPTTNPEPDSLGIPIEERDLGGLGVFLAIEGVDQFKYERVNNSNRNIFIVNRPTAKTN